jgi:hypothetical protein
MRRRALTHHTVRCPLEGHHNASLTVRTDPDGRPSRRHLDVMACSLLPSTSFVPPSSYHSDVDSIPRHSGVGCPKPCLAVLNAAEPGSREALRCTSGVSDGLELTRQVQSPAITAVLWSHST